MPAETVRICSESAAILFGAVGGPGHDHLPPDKRPEAAILGLRKHFNLYANVRPARVFPGMETRSPLRSELVDGMDLVFIRELTGGLYFGEKTLTTEDGHETVRDVLIYRDYEIERVARFAFALARMRGKRLTSVDKNNVLLSSQLWRRIVIDVAKDFPDVTLEHMLVDNAAMQLVRDPRAFDVIVTENMFGDILSDEAAMITGTIGTASSAALNGAPDAERLRALRTDQRNGARHRRQRARQSDRRDSLGRDARALLARRRSRRGGDRTGGCGNARRGTAHARSRRGERRVDQCRCRRDRRADQPGRRLS